MVPVPRPEPLFRDRDNDPAVAQHAADASKRIDPQDHRHGGKRWTHHVPGREFAWRTLVRPAILVAVQDETTSRAAPPPGAERRPVLFVNAHYYPDVAATAHHLTDLAEHLAAVGYAVEICTAQATYGPLQGTAPAEEVRNGVRVLRVRATTFGRARMLGRLIDYASFHWQVLRLLIFSSRYRYVVFLTTPPLLHAVGWLALRIRGVRYAVWSMDLHPAAEFTTGVIDRGSLLGRALARVHVIAHRAADFVIAVGPYMRDRLLADGLDPARVVWRPVWVNTDAVRPLTAAENRLRAELGLDGRFVVAYIGNAGLVHDFTAVLDAIRSLANHPRMSFLFVGGGPRRPEIDAFLRANGIGNVVVRDYYPVEMVPLVYALADVHLVTLAPPFSGIAVPTKCYVAMATGRPVLFVGGARCEPADAIRDSGGGACIDTERPDAARLIASTLTAWSESPAEVARLGQLARTAAIARFDRRESCASIEAVLRERWPEVAPRAVPRV